MDIDRFISLRKSLGYTQKTFAACLGIPNTTADIERGKTKLSGKIVVELIKQFQVNPLWIYGESNVQFIKNTVVNTIPKVVTIDAEGNDNMVLVNAKAAHKILVIVVGTSSCPHLIYLFQNSEMLLIGGFK
jgi:DNA-binding XRE family transcriptional regulator